MAGFLEQARASVTVKLAFVAALVLVLLIPMSMIESLIDERRAQREVAKAGIRASWGRPQTVGAPILVVPYRAVMTRKDGRRETITRHAHVLPASLDVAGTLATEIRYRGIHEVPVYTARVEVAGVLAPAALAELGVDPAAADWERAFFALPLTDARSIKEAVRLEVDGESVAFEPGGARVAGFPPQLVARAPAALAARLAEGGARFRVRLALGGTDALRVLPLGDRTRVRLRGDWASPSFAGAWLPAGREVGAEGFAARWEVLHLGRGYPSRWRDRALDADAVEASAFGVDLYAPVGVYRVTTRAAKYAVLFVGLTFVVYFLLEVLGGLALHPLQYLLVGLANCLFYLLLLALSEHVALGLAYAAAAGASSALVAGYSAAVLGDRRRAALVLALLAGLYGFLWVTLRAEDYALLMGSLMLLAVLAGVMYATRRVDWYRAGAGLAARVARQRADGVAPPRADGVAPPRTDPA